MMQFPFVSRRNTFDKRVDKTRVQRRRRGIVIEQNAYRPRESKMWKPKWMALPKLIQEEDGPVAAAVTGRCSTKRRLVDGESGCWPGIRT